MIKRVFAAVLAACLAPHAAVPVRVAVIHTREASLLQLEFEVRRIASLLQVEEIVLSQCNKSSSDVRCAIQVNYGYRSAPIPGDTASVPPDWIQTLDTLRVPGGNPERLVILPTQIDVGGPAGTAHFDEKDVALVRNWYPHMPLCGYPPCPPGDSAGIRKNLVSRLQRTGVAYRFVPNDSSLGFGPWRRATGKEPLGLLTTPFPSNAGNWLRKRTANFAVEVLAGRNDNLPERMSYATGLVEYAYNSPVPPGAEPLSGRQASRWQNVAKIGDPAILKEQAVVLCYYGVGDSDVVKNSWLAIPDSLTESAVYAAFWDTTATGVNRQTGCVRPGAWQMSHDTVFLWKNRYPVPLGDLFQTAGLAPRASSIVLSARKMDLTGRPVSGAERGIVLERTPAGGWKRIVRLGE